MPDPRIAKSLDRLRAQVQKLFPDAPKNEFGWIASAEHRRQNPNSDHNEDELGIVRALDIPHVPAIGLDTYDLASHLRDVGNAGREPRLKYVISNRRIWNPSISKAWRPYNGKNAHDQHIHVSVVRGDVADDPRDWDLGDVFTQEPDETVTSRPLLKRGMSGEDVRLVQRALMLDGIFGPLTEQAVRRFQALEELDDDGIVGPLTWKALRFRYPELFVELPPPPGVSEWHTDITATVFGGSTETQHSAYDNHVITDDEYGIGLPFRFAGERRLVQVHNVATNEAVNARIVDVGPWMIDDDYWTRGERPIAETCFKTKSPLPRGPNKGRIPTNPAGIDMTPATSNALGIDGLGRVNWRFV